MDFLIMFYNVVLFYSIIIRVLELLTRFRGSFGELWGAKLLSPWPYSYNLKHFFCILQKSCLPSPVIQFWIHPWNLIHLYHINRFSSSPKISPRNDVSTMGQRFPKGQFYHFVSRIIIRGILHLYHFLYVSICNKFVKTVWICFWCYTGYATKFRILY